MTLDEAARVVKVVGKSAIDEDLVDAPPSRHDVATTVSARSCA
jgi:hypothetical protein